VVASRGDFDANRGGDNRDQRDKSSLGIEARALDRSVDAWKYRRSKTNNIKIEPAMSEASTVPPRSTWAKTVTASTTHATNQARRCPVVFPGPS